MCRGEGAVYYRNVEVFWNDLGKGTRLMEILLIGNGFDIEHGLPTKYINFLSFVREFQNTYEKLENHSIKVNDIEDSYFKSLFSDSENLIVEALVQLTFENLWIKYFQRIHQLHLKNKENWIDFESEISDVIKTLDSALKLYKDKENGDSSNRILPNHLTSKLILVMGEGGILQKNNIKNCAGKLLNDLNRLICALEIYIWDYIDYAGNYGSNIRYYNPDINEIYPDAVLSFNYSDTYRRVYAYKRKNIEYDFIHGKAKNNLCHPFNIDEFLEKSNLVLGIDEYLPKDSREIDFIAFKKYYQRIYKCTGNQYKRWLEQIDKKKEESKLYIFGHSLDETDGDILRDLINNDRIQTIIYYKDKKSLGQQIANLVKVLSRDKVIEKVYGHNPSIKFIQQREREKIKGSSFEIVSDISKLEQIYKLHADDAQYVLDKLKRKIENKQLEYFYSQKDVISLYDVLQRIGLSKQYRNLLLDIACKLMSCEGLKQAEKYSYEDWEHIEYDNSRGCDYYTMEFIDLVNEYNERNFVQEEYFETFYEGFEEIKRTILNKDNIDKDKFMEIINHIFYLFHDLSINTEELWTVLVSVAVGPAGEIAKDTLNELIKSSDSQLDIVRYHHLISEIQMNEYFAMQQESYMED